MHSEAKEDPSNFNRTPTRTQSTGLISRQCQGEVGIGAREFLGEEREKCPLYRQTKFVRDPNGTVHCTVLRYLTQFNPIRLCNTYCEKFKYKYYNGTKVIRVNLSYANVQCTNRHTRRVVHSYPPRPFGGETVPPPVQNGLHRNLLGCSPAASQ
eukprot:419884-Rhodomonas_salina.2